jgi:CDGSH-type Zn-finger protein
MAEPVVFQKRPIVQKVEPGTYWWCACGRSASQPFCDGSHAGTGLGPKEVEITEPKTVAWCACKHSKNMPFCDGTHSTLV